MPKITVLGLGAMGSRMAANLLKAGHIVVGFDLVTATLQAIEYSCSSLPALFFFQ